MPNHVINIRRSNEGSAIFSGTPFFPVVSYHSFTWVQPHSGSRPVIHPAGSLYRSRHADLYGTAGGAAGFRRQAAATMAVVIAPRGRQLPRRRPRDAPTRVRLRVLCFRASLSVSMQI